MYEKILVPLDGSVQSQRSAEYAIELAKSMNSQVVFIHVIPVLPPYERHQSGSSESAYQHLHDDLRQSGEGIIENAKALFGKEDINASYRLLWGNPAMEICHFAKEEDISLIVMGNRGLGEIKGYLIGSISNRVVRHASCPVMIVR
ncbi:MAG: universal stress protein [Peptococcaceae bacterium]|nr:universal stress protein [Peptococcaceae bacterium]